MSELPFISICIPAYKRIHHLQRLLDSIAIQTYTRYEVVVTDDSPDDSVEKLVRTCKAIPGLRYYRNRVSLGTPQNWNESINKAIGPWIKLMHDDDWFSRPESLAFFVAAIQPGRNFIFSAYKNVYEENRPAKLLRPSKLEKKLVWNNPATLVAKNVIGPPSVTFYRKTALQYDTRMKWLVDVDFYIHYLKDNKFGYIDEPLINVSVSQQQVTQSCFRVPEVEIPEHFLLMKKAGLKHLRHLMVYDASWRLMRNLNISSTEQIRQAGYYGVVPPVISAIISDQVNIPSRILGSGIFSKICMFVSYLRRKHLIK